MNKYVKLLENEPNFPILCDSTGLIMAVPPLINSEQSRLTVDTRNVFIDVTAKDLTKAHIVLNILLTMFSIYCEQPFTVEPVEVTNIEGNKIIYPIFEKKHFTTDKDYLNRTAGTNITSEEICTLLKKMSLIATHNGNEINVEVPITRTGKI